MCHLPVDGSPNPPPRTGQPRLATLPLGGACVGARRRPSPCQVPPVTRPAPAEHHRREAGPSSLHPPAPLGGGENPPGGSTTEKGHYVDYPRPASFTWGATGTLVGVALTGVLLVRGT